MADAARWDDDATNQAPADDGSDRLLFRRVMGRFATGVTVVTTVQDRMDHAMTANSFTSVSLEPPLVLVCVETDTRFYDAIAAVETWGVSVLAEQARIRAAWLATKGRPLEGQLASVPHRRGPATGVPLLRESLATLECSTVSLTEAGDHFLVVGRVLSLEVDDTYRRPLLYWSSEYHGIDGPLG